MADEIYSRVSRRVWADAKWRTLSRPAGGAWLWHYLLSCGRCTPLPGLIGVGLLAIAEDLDWTVEATTAAMAEIVDAGMASFDAKAKLVWLHNAVRHNVPANPSVVLGWRNAWMALPECDLRTKAGAAILDRMRVEDYERGTVGDGFAVAFEVAMGLKHFRDTKLNCGRPRSSRPGSSGKTASSQGSFRPSSKPSPRRRNTVFRQEQEQEQDQGQEQDQEGEGSGSDARACSKVPVDANRASPLKSPDLANEGPGTDRCRVDVPHVVAYAVTVQGTAPVVVPAVESPVAPPPLPAVVPPVTPSAVPVDVRQAMDDHAGHVRGAIDAAAPPLVPLPPMRDAPHLPANGDSAATWHSFTRDLVATTGSKYACNLLSDLDSGKMLFPSADQRRVLLDIYAKNCASSTIAVLPEPLARLSKRWMDARAHAGLPTGMAPDASLLAEYWSKCTIVADSAKPDATGWRPTARDVAWLGIRAYLASAQVKAGGVKDQGYPFAWLARSNKVGEEYPLPRRCDVEKAPRSTASPTTPPSHQDAATTTVAPAEEPWHVRRPTVLSPEAQENLRHQSEMAARAAEAAFGPNAVRRMTRPHLDATPPPRPVPSTPASDTTVAS